MVTYNRCRRKIEMSPRAQSRDDTPAANTRVRNGITAKRGVRVRGSRAIAGVPVRAAQPLRPAPATQHHGAVVRPSLSGEMRGKPFRRSRFFVGMPGASRLFGGRPRAGS